MPELILYTLEGSFPVTGDSLEKLKKIRQLLDEAQSLFTTLSVQEQDAILNIHVAEGSLNHCLRWGTIAAADVLEKIKPATNEPESWPPTPPGFGRIWWIADDQKELEQWRSQWDSQPIEIIDTTPHNDGSTRISVIFQLEKAKACQLLGYAVDEDEWLED